jgi:TonB family protein
MAQLQRLALVVLFFFGAICAVHAQQPSLPAAPAPSPTPAEPSFKVPPPSYDIPKDAPPPSSPKEQVCFAPPEGIYTKSNEAVPPGLEGQMDNYTYLVLQRVFNQWGSHMTRRARMALARGRKLAVRFAVFPDGTYDRPTVTVSSGSPELDSSVLHVIEVQPNFPPPPRGMQHPIPMCFRFALTLDKLGLNPDTYAH